MSAMDRAPSRYEVVWPLARKAKPPGRLQPRLQDLTGKTIAFIWDYAFLGDKMFYVLREEIERRYSDVKFVDYAVFGNIEGLDQVDVINAVPDKLKENGVDAAIVGVGA